MSGEVEVTGADEDAADKLDDALGFLTELERPIVVQAFARHRLASAAADAGGVDDDGDLAERIWAAVKAGPVDEALAFIRSSLTVASAPAADVERLRGDHHQSIIAWREAFDAMHQRAMRAEAALASQPAQKAGETPGGPTQTDREAAKRASCDAWPDEADAAERCAHYEGALLGQLIERNRTRDPGGEAVREAVRNILWKHLGGDTRYEAITAATNDILAALQPAAPTELGEAS